MDKTNTNNMKCRHNDGVHVCRTAETGCYILIYCENCSMNIKWIDKEFPLLN